MPPVEKTFRGIFTAVLDYSEQDFLEKCAQWGLEQYVRLEKHEKLLADGNTSDNGYFIYGVAFAVIVGEFGQRAFNNWLSEPDGEIDLDALKLDFRDIEGYLEEDMDAERRGRLQQYNCVELQDVWSATWEWKQHIYKELTGIYAAGGEKYPDYAIYTSLLKIFEQKDEETGEAFLPSQRFDEEMNAYQYVSAGFSY